MPMALLGIDFRAHQSDWMFHAIQEKMQVSGSAKKFFDDVLIVPVPYYFATARLNRLCSDIAGHAKLGKMYIV